MLKIRTWLAFMDIMALRVPQNKIIHKVQLGSKFVASLLNQNRYATKPFLDLCSLGFTKFIGDLGGLKR